MIIFQMVFGAVIAAFYIVLTLAVTPLAYGPVQFRLSEILTILPALTPAAIPGVTIGCLLANVLNPGGTLGLVDIIGGTVATFISAILTRVLAKHMKLDESQAVPARRRDLLKRPSLWVLTLPPILINSLIVGTYLTILLVEQAERSGGILLFNMLTVGLGEIVMAGFGGILLYLAVAPRMHQLYRRYQR